MFMIEKSLIVIIFMYASGIALLGAQYIWADTFHVTMTNFSGQPLKNNLLTDLHQDTFNKVTNSTLQTNSTIPFVDAVGLAGSIGWDLILLVSGTYIFDILLQLGVPIIFIIGFVFLYIFLLMRSIMGWIRGI